jgi:ribosomal protein S18 acetylase RimI-like enzyme
MVKLVPMTVEDFDAYLERGIAEYAEDKVKAGNWNEAEALQKSQDEYQKFLPQGLATAGHHLFSILDDETSLKVGMLWMAEERDWARPTGYIFDLFIEEHFRQQGFASRAMLALESKAVELGLELIALQVFGHNQAARALYEKLGYAITNINMAKELKPRAGT